MAKTMTAIAASNRIRHDDRRGYWEVIILVGPLVISRSVQIRVQLKVLVEEERLEVLHGIRFVSFLAVRCNIVLHIVSGERGLFKVKVLHFGAFALLVSAADVSIYTARIRQRLTG